MIKTYTVARLPVRLLIRLYPKLANKPIFRRYADGGDLSTPERARQSQKEWEAQRDWEKKHG